MFVRGIVRRVRKLASSYYNNIYPLLCAVISESKRDDYYIRVSHLNC